MEAVSQTGTRASAPPMMSTQSPGTKLTVGHEAPLDIRPPRLTASAPTIATDRSSHYRLRPFPFHLDVPRLAARNVNPWVKLFRIAARSPPRGIRKIAPMLNDVRLFPAF
jgi:hypothetical protein